MRTAEHVAAQNKAVAGARGDLSRAWSVTAGLSPERRREALALLWPQLVTDWGEVSATVAAQHFEDVTGMPAALAGVSAAPESRTGWGLAPLADEDDAAALARMWEMTDELVKQPGRDTIIESAGQRRIRFARVPVGKTCAFCIMLAGRGAVYHTPETAGALRRFHHGCDCLVEAVVDESDLRRLEAEYPLAEARTAYSRNRRSSPAATLAAMRKDLGTN